MTRQSGSAGGDDGGEMVVMITRIEVGDRWVASGHLGNHAQDLAVGLGWSQDPQFLQTSQAAHDLSLLLLQAQAAVSRQRCAAAHLVGRAGILLCSPLHQPIMAHPL